MSNYLQKIVYLTKAQAQTLFDTGSVTSDGITVNYNDNDLYVTSDDKAPLNQLLEGTYTNATITSPYKPVLWTYNADVTEQDGDIIIIKIPECGGHSNGIFLSINNGTTYHPVNLYSSVKMEQEYNANTTIALIYDASGTTNNIYPVEGDTSQVSTNNGCWRVLNYSADKIADVQINNSSIVGNRIANIPVADVSTLGTVKVASSTSTLTGIRIQQDGLLRITEASSDRIKGGTVENNPISPVHQHESVFYGLAKVAGHDEASSTETLGTYTPEAKGAIQQMLGISDLIAPAENSLVASKAYAIGDIFTANGKLYKVISAIAANGTIILQDSGETISGANAIETQISGIHVRSVFYGTCETSPATKTKEVVLTDDTNFSLSAGVMIAVKFTYASAASTMLMVIKNTNGETLAAGKNLYKYASQLMSNNNQEGWPAQAVVLFLYDGDAWYRIYWWDDTTSQYRTRHNTISVGSITSGHLIVANATTNEYQDLDSGQPFNILYPILYSGITSTTTTNNTFLIFENALLTNTQSGTYTQYAPVYIKGTINGTTFTPISATPLVQTINQVDDGYVYYYIGLTHTTARLSFDATGRIIYQYKNGAIHRYY